METASELNVHVLQDFHSKWAKYWLITNEASNLQIIYQRKVHNFSPSTDEIILVHCFCCDRKQKVITVFVAAARMTASFCHSTFTCSCSVSVPQISCGRSKPGSDRALTMMVLGIYCSETYSQHRGTGSLLTPLGLPESWTVAVMPQHLRWVQERDFQGSPLSWKEN